MSRTATFAALVATSLALAPGAALARGLGVELWTDRGQDAVYQPGQDMQVKVRVSDDAYLLVYVIDTEGYVSVLYPYRGANGFVEGRRTLLVPDEDSQDELVVEQTTGEAYIVAITSDRPFADMPWYLRPYDPHSEGVSYQGQPQDEEGITSEGRIVGDPFVAMERIRRRVLSNPSDPESFATAYTSYFVHERVRYPRYLCYDCHRPNHWAWWDGFDPYYTTCTVVDFRINWGWYWGPTYWFGSVPYFCYVPRPDCAPRWRRYWSSGWYSSWDGWRRWNSMWGGPLVRYKTPPPPGYRPPSKYDDPTRWRDGAPAPPGILVSKGQGARYRPLVPIGRNRGAGAGDGVADRRLRDGQSGRDPNPGRMPVREVRPGDDRGATDRGRDVRVERPNRGYDRPAPSTPSREERGYQRPAPSAPSREERGYQRPAPSTPSREERGYQRPAPSTPSRGERGYERSTPSAPSRGERGYQRSSPPAPRQADPPRNSGGDQGQRQERGRR